MVMGQRTKLEDKERAAHELMGETFENPGDNLVRF
jgi:hypothetical protein